MQNNVQMNKEIWLTNSVKNDLITEESIYVFIFIYYFGLLICNEKINKQKI